MSFTPLRWNTPVFFAFSCQQHSFILFLCHHLAPSLCVASAVIHIKTPRIWFRRKCVNGHIVRKLPVDLFVQKWVNRLFIVRLMSSSSYSFTAGCCASGHSGRFFQSVFFSVCVCVCVCGTVWQQIPIYLSVHRISNLHNGCIIYLSTTRLYPGVKHYICYTVDSLFSGKMQFLSFNSSNCHLNLSRSTQSELKSGFIFNNFLVCVFWEIFLYIVFSFQLVSTVPFNTRVSVVGSIVYRSS